LADRYVVEAAWHVANGREVPTEIADAFERLPEVMADAAQVEGQLERGQIDLAEAVMVADRVGSVFTAVVTDVDQRGARVQLCDLPVVARVDARRVQPGDDVHVRLTAADVEAGSIRFERVG
jgi:exoribonuclease R